jgi:hypothetical protein
MKNKFSITDLAIILVAALILVLPTFFVPEKYNLYDYLKSKRLESYNEKYKKHLVTCIYCKGTGERVEDVNRIIFMAKVQLYLNKHLAVDKCEKCVKMPETGSYIYCDEANNQYSVFLKEYGAAGPKMEMTSCGECMGMGTFTIMNKDGSYLTQEEYENRERNKTRN